jgi:hypothetical protein
VGLVNITEIIARIERDARDANTVEAYRNAITVLTDLPETEDDVPYVEDAVTRMGDARDALPR